MRKQRGGDQKRYQNMDEAARYWCHMCSQMVNPIMDVDMIECPLCQSGFVEEMDSSAPRGDHSPLLDDYYFGGGGSGGGGGGTTESESDRALSLWAPILLGMMSNTHRRRRFRRRLDIEDEVDDEDESDHNNNNNNSQRDVETELHRELESLIRRRTRRRSPASILPFLHGLRAEMLSESENSESQNRNGDRDTSEIRDRERVILINPFNQTIIVQGGSHDSFSSEDQNHNPIGSLGDYFIGPGLDLLLQHLAENDPNRYGTPPAQKEAVEAMPTVKIEENLQCSVCLEDLEIGTDGREMPCKHKFHGKCILPWLELHSSCPVCRYQLPTDVSKLDSDVSRNNGSNDSGRERNNDNGSSGEDGDGDGRNGNGNGNGRRFPFPWPISRFFSSSGNGNSSSSASSTNASRNDSGAGEN